MSLVAQTVTIPEELRDKIDQLIADGKYATVSEFVRQAIKLALDNEIQRAKRVDDITSDTEVGSGRLVDTGGASVKGSDQLPPTSHTTIVINTSPQQWTVGKVQRGQQLGGKLGFPTLNLEPTLLAAQTETGVYAGLVEYDDVVYQAAVHYGPRKTLGEWRPTLELHLLDFNKHIPGALVRFQLFGKIRETMKFDSLDSLKQQLAEDVQRVRDHFRSDT